MQIQVVKSKIHRVKVTGAELNYIGSITIDEDLMELIALTDYSEQIAVERVKALIQLSRIKGIGVGTLMKEK